MGSRRTGEHQRPPPATKKGESQETVVDSGIEELDSRSSSDHHLDSILALSGARLDRGERGGGAGGRMGGGGGAGESDRGGDFLESYMSYLDGQTFEMQNATAAASTYPKANRFREGGRTGDLHRQTSTAPASYHSHRRRDEQEDDDGEGGVTEDESGQDGYGVRDMQNLGRPISPYFDRPRTPEMKPHWGEGQMTGDGGQSGTLLEGKKIYPPVSSMKPSIINELSSKLQQRSKDSWSSQRPLSRHRYMSVKSLALCFSKSQHELRFMLSLMHSIAILSMCHLCERIGVPPPTIAVQAFCEKRCTVFLCLVSSILCKPLFYFSGFFHVFLSEAETGNRATSTHERT